MTYINPEIESSYRQNDIGQTLYNYVLEFKPKIIVEFGCLYGYSTVAMGMALKELGRGKIICYDLWENYKYKHSTIQQTMNNVEKYGVEKYVKFVQMDYYEWLSKPIKFDMMHLDISNDGNTIMKTHDALLYQLHCGSTILFEGGSEERDEVEWMKKYKAIPINAVKEHTNYEIINDNFPSLSILQK